MKGNGASARESAQKTYQFAAKIMNREKRGLEDRKSIRQRLN